MTGPQLPRDPRRRRNDGRHDPSRDDHRDDHRSDHRADPRTGPRDGDERRAAGIGGSHAAEPPAHEDLVAERRLDDEGGWDEHWDEDRIEDRVADGVSGSHDDPYDHGDDDRGDPYDHGDDGPVDGDEIAAEVPADAAVSRRQGLSSWSRALVSPDFVSPPRRSWRAWLLILGTLVFPGSAQIAAGHRRLGRIALPITVLCWAVLLVMVLSGLLWRSPLVFLLTNGVSAPVIAVALVVAAIWWAVLWLDTLRLLRPGLLARRARIIACAGLVGLLAATSGGLIYSAHLINVTRATVGEIFSGGMPVRAAEGRHNILLMGADAGEDRVGLRPDSMTVLSIDADSGQTATISLPRNLQNVPFPEDSPMHEIYPEGYDCGDECLLNAVYTEVTADHPEIYGEDVEDPGAEAMKDAASGALGIEVDSYAMIDMSGFEQLVDALGGITIDVGGEVPIGGGTNEITGLPNPIDGYIEPGVQQLDGFHALWYARSREGASDYDRQARQRCVQAAMLKQMNPANVVSQFEELAAAGQQVVETDIPQSSLGSFVDLAVKAKGHEFVPYAAGPPYYDPLFPTYPDYDQLHADVRDLLASAEGQDDGSASAGRAIGGGPLGSTGLAVITAQTSDGTEQIAPEQLTPEQPDPTDGAPAELSPNGTCSVP